MSVRLDPGFFEHLVLMIFTLAPAVRALPGVFSAPACLRSSPLGQGPLMRLGHHGIFLNGHLTATTPNRRAGPWPYTAVRHELVGRTKRVLMQGREPVFAKHLP